jgi:hypothetical protein
MPKTYTAAGTVSAGDVYTAAAHNIIATDVNNFIVPPTCQARVTTTITGYVDGSDITFNTTAAFDTDGMFSSGAPTRITVQTSGLYVVSFIGGYDGVATITRALTQIKKNGGGAIVQQEVFGNSTSGSFSTSAILNLNASDFLTVGLSFAGGSAYRVIGNATEATSQTRLTATWIGRTA